MRRVCLPVALLAVCSAVLVGAGSAVAAPAAKSKTITFYSIATKEQFLNHSDDRARGKGNNPFAGFKDTVGPSGKETSGNGPFAGDRTVFTFALFSDQRMQTRIGSAQLICEYVFDQNAFCSAAYVFPKGELVGTGYFNFNAKRYRVVRGRRDGKYRNQRGHLQADPAVKKLQKITVTFVLIAQRGSSGRGSVARAFARSRTLRADGSVCGAAGRDGERVNPADGKWTRAEFLRRAGGGAVALGLAGGAGVAAYRLLDSRARRRGRRRPARLRPALPLAPGPAAARDRRPPPLAVRDGAGPPLPRAVVGPRPARGDDPRRRGRGRLVPLDLPKTSMNLRVAL